MPLVYGRQIATSPISSYEVGTANPQKPQEQDTGHHWDWTHPFKSIAGAINEYIVSPVYEYAVKPELEYVFGGGHSNVFTDFVGQAVDTIMKLPSGVLELTDNVVAILDGQSDYEAGTIGHTLLQSAALAAAFIPGAGPLLAAAIMAADTTWSTIDLANSGHGSWQDYTIMWGTTAAAGYAGAKSTVKFYKERGAVKTFYKQKVDEHLKLTLKDLKEDVQSGFYSQQEYGSGVLRETSATSKWQQDFQKGFGKNPFRKIEKSIGRGLKEASTREFRPEVTSKEIKTFYKEAGSRGLEGARKSIYGGELRTTDPQSKEDKQFEDTLRELLTEDELLGLTVYTRNISGRTLTSRVIRNTKFLRKLSPKVRAALETAYERAYGISGKARKPLVKVTSQPTGFLKQFKSASFYQGETQFFQDLAGSDAGRQGVEMLYSWLRHGGRGKYFINNEGVMEYKPPRWGGLDEWLDKKGWSKVSENLKKSAKLEKKFIASGGVAIRSKYLLGYKILYSAGSVAGINEVMMYFRTGKAPIIIRASDQDLEKLVSEGSQYWFGVGKQKGWFMSRGGRKPVGTRSTSGLISTILAIMPIQMIRTLGSIIHNVKDVQKAFREEGLGYFKTWGKDFVSAMYNTFTNRVGRTITAGFVGAKYGRWAGRASQQVGTAFMNSAIPKLSHEDLGWKPKTNFKTTMFGSGKSNVLNTVVGKRIQSDLKSHLYKKTGTRYIVGSMKRKGSIRGSVLGHGTRKSTGWAGGWL